MSDKQNNKRASIPASSLQYRKDFFSALQQTNESAEEWLHRVKELAQLCSFGKLNDIFVLNKFLTGLETKIVEHLCTNSQCLDFDNSLEIIGDYNKQKTDSKPIQMVDVQNEDLDSQTDTKTVNIFYRIIN